MEALQRQQQQQRMMDEAWQQQGGGASLDLPGLGRVTPADMARVIPLLPDADGAAAGEMLPCRRLQRPRGLTPSPPPWQQPAGPGSPRTSPSTCEREGEPVKRTWLGDGISEVGGDMHQQTRYIHPHNMATHPLPLMSSCPRRARLNSSGNDDSSRAVASVTCTRIG